MKHPMLRLDRHWRCLSRWWWLPPCCWPCHGGTPRCQRRLEVDARRVPGSVRAGTQPAPTSLGCCAWPCGDSAAPRAVFRPTRGWPLARRRPSRLIFDPVRPPTVRGPSGADAHPRHRSHPPRPAAAGARLHLLVHRPPGDRDPDRADQTRIRRVGHDDGPAHRPCVRAAVRRPRCTPWASWRIAPTGATSWPSAAPSGAWPRWPAASRSSSGSCSLQRA